jgi:hypothetical protein
VPKAKKKLSLKKVMAAIEDGGYPGFCIACGAQSDDNCEPDAQNYPCSSCGKNKVFGAEEILFMMVP